MFDRGPGARILTASRALGYPKYPFVSVFINQQYVKAIGPGKLVRTIKRKDVAGLVADGYEESGTMGEYECYVLHRTTAPLPQAVSGQAVHARGDESCKHFAVNQRMGNCYELVGV